MRESWFAIVHTAGWSDSRGVNTSGNRGYMRNGAATNTKRCIGPELCSVLLGG